MKANSVVRRQKRSENGALFTGLLFDDRGNRMTPSFTTKRDVRYRFYVSTALLKGRKQEAGTLPRISGPDLEAAVLAALKEEQALLQGKDLSTDPEIVRKIVNRIEVGQNNIRIILKASSEITRSHKDSTSEADKSSHRSADLHIDVPWQPNSNGPLARIDEIAARGGEPDPALVQAVARAHSWTNLLVDGEHHSIESLAASINMHPKVVRKSIRLAFLAPEITEAIVLGCHPKSLNLTDLQLATSLSWLEQRRRLGIGENDNLPT